MAQSLNNLLGRAFNDLYAQRPVWALASNGAVANNSPAVALYGELSPYVPINVEFSGNARSRARSFQDEMANSSKLFMGSTTQAAAAATFAPNTGSYGITCNTQTGALFNFDITDNGNYGYYDANSAGANTVAAASGVVVGESNWRQCYDLLLSSGTIRKEEIGGGWSTATAGNRPSISLAGLLPNDSGYWGWGQISHNRKTGRLLIVQPVSGVNGTSLTYRLHLLDLQNKISRDTTIAQLKSWITDAVAVGSGRYRYADVVFSSASVYYSNQSTYDIAFSKFVLCDNDEVWMFKSSDSATAGSTAKTNTLFRVNLSGGTWLTGAYAATAALTFAGQTTYGSGTNTLYGPRHLNSDDNSVIALYQHYYQYLHGLNLVAVSTAAASSTGYNYAQDTSTVGGGWTIAPVGGPDFVLCKSGANNDALGPSIAFMDNTNLGSTNIALTISGYLWPSYSSSTAYGANAVLKVQPTSEWK